MSLLLLFHGSAPVLKTGSGKAAAGASARVSAAKGAYALGNAVAGASTRAVGVRGTFGTAHALAGAYARAGLSGRTGSLTARAAAGASIRARGGKGAPGFAAAAAGAFVRARSRPLHVGIPLSRLTRLVLFLDPSEVAITEQGSDAPYSLLITIDAVRIAARAGTVSGIGATESTSAAVSLDNQGGRALDLIGRPLRVRAEIYDHEELFFTGTVTQINYGQTIDLTIEA